MKNTISVIIIMVMLTACKPEVTATLPILPTLTPNPTRTLTPVPSPTPTVAPTLAEAPLDYPFSELPGWVAHFEADFRAECGGILCTNLWIVRPDFSDYQKLTDPAYGLPDDIVWSPNGRFIAYVFMVLGESGGVQLWVYDMQRKRASLLTPEFIDSPEYISWSPDSKYLLLSNQVKDSEDWRLVKLDVVTKKQTMLLEGPEYTEISPAWSPGGESIVFSAKKDKGTQLLWSMPTDGSAVTALSTDTGMPNLRPAWKPDGSSLAYYQETQGVTELWTMDFDGFHPRKQVELGVITVLETPVWSPDGKYLATVYGTGKKTKVLLLDLETSATLEVNRTEGNFTTVTWSPDSKAFIYMELQGSRGDVLNLFVLNDGNPFAVDTAVDLFLNPVWSPAEYKP